MAVANTLAYYDTATIMTVKCFLISDPLVEVNDSGKHSSLLQNYGCKRVYRTGPWGIQKNFFQQGILADGEKLSTIDHLNKLARFV